MHDYPKVITIHTQTATDDLLTVLQNQPKVARTCLDFGLGEEPGVGAQCQSRAVQAGRIPQCWDRVWVSSAEGNHWAPEEGQPGMGTGTKKGEQRLR